MDAHTENQLITVGDIPVQVIEYRGMRVVTFAMMDQLHQRPDGTASRNFQYNRARFVEGEDYFRLSFSEVSSLNEIQQIGVQPNSQGLILLTPSGYFMLVKSFKDDLAWKVQRELVNRYFQFPPAKSKAHELLRSVQLLVEQEERLQRVADEQLRQRFKGSW